MRLCILALTLSFALAHAQDRGSWRSLAELQSGDQVKVAFKSQKSITGTFQSWTPGQITVDSASFRKEDVATVHRYRKGAWSRRKTVLVGAAIGGGVGVAIGAATGGNCEHEIGPCISRAGLGGALGAVGAIIGAGIAALLPHHEMDLMYAAK